MPDFIGIHQHLVVFRMVAVIVRHFIRELFFQRGIGAFGGFHVFLFRGIRADDDRLQHGLRQRRAGLQTAHHEKQHRGQRDHGQRCRMTGKVP